MSCFPLALALELADISMCSNYTPSYLLVLDGQFRCCAAKQLSMRPFFVKGVVVQVTGVCSVTHEKALGCNPRKTIQHPMEFMDCGQIVRALGPHSQWSWLIFFSPPRVCSFFFFCVCVCVFGFFLQVCDLFARRIIPKLLSWPRTSE